MDKKLLVAMLSSMGIGVGATLVFQNGEDPPLPYAVFVHALRISAPTAPTGEIVGPDVITAWRTRVTLDAADGGAAFEDIGEAQCTGESKVVRSMVANCKGFISSDGPRGMKIESSFPLKNVYVIEARPVPGSEGKMVATEVYGSNGSARCELERTPEFVEFLTTIECIEHRHRAPVPSL